MRIAEAIGRIVDLFYVRPFSQLLSPTMFRYAACGAANMALDLVWYFVIYHFVICKRFIDVGFVVVSPHIASLVLVFPITFFTGFWLNRNVAFRSTSIGHGRQLWRYALSVAGAIVINYFSMKLLVEACDVWPTPAKMLTTVLSSIYSFLAAKFFTFREEKA